VKGILMGSRGSVQATPDLRLRFLRAEPTLEPGTQIVSDGVSEQGVFPYGILLGEVKEFYKKDLGGEALVRPAVEIDTLKYVFVLRREEAAPPPPKAKPIAE
jgi:cell shape-determining protein MreC